MKKVFTLLMMLVAFTCFSQNQETSSEPIDSGPLLVETPADTSAFSLETGLSIYTRYFWRGVKFGSGPSLQGLMEFSHKKGFGVGAYVCGNLTGSFMDFGNTTNLYIWYGTDIGDDGGITVILDDYYFYNEDNADDAFDYTDTTRHYIEARLEGNCGKFDGTVGYSIYQGDIKVDPDTGEVGEQDSAPYIELGYSVNNDTRLFIGGVTGASALNFQDKEGITNIGITHSRDLRGLPVETTFVVNPAYKNISDVPGATRSAISLVVAITL